MLVRAAYEHLIEGSRQSELSAASEIPRFGLHPPRVILTLPVPSATASSRRWEPGGSVTLSPKVAASTTPTSTFASFSSSHLPPVRQAPQWSKYAGVEHGINHMGMNHIPTTISCSRSWTLVTHDTCPAAIAAFTTLCQRAHICRSKASHQAHIQSHP